MADDHPAGMPQRPAGFQRPGIPGAGNLLDPAVRGELREKLQAAVQDTVEQPHRESEEAAAPMAAPAAEPAATPVPVAYRAGPFPHGDVDLRGLAANLAPGPVRPRRGRA